MVQAPIVHLPTGIVHETCVTCCDHLFRLTGKSHAAEQPFVEQLLIDNGFRWPYVAPTVQPWQTAGDVVQDGGNWTRSVSDLDVESECLAAIDCAADLKRVALVSPGSLVDQEYLMAYDDAQTYKSAGYTGEVPGGVSTWATPNGWTAQQAADDIIYQRAVWKQCSDAIRAIRLNGKQAVKDATTAEGKWNAMTAAIAQFGALGW